MKDNIMDMNEPLLKTNDGEQRRIKKKEEYFDDWNIDLLKLKAYIGTKHRIPSTTNNKNSDENISHHGLKNKHKKCIYSMRHEANHSAWCKFTFDYIELLNSWNTKYVNLKEFIKINNEILKDKDESNMASWLSSQNINYREKTYILMKTDNRYHLWTICKRECLDQLETQTDIL